MSKIESLRPNSLQIVNQKRAKLGQTPSFSGGLSDYPQAGKFLLNKCKPQETAMKKNISKLSVYLAEHKGEMQSQLINATFTTTLAPVFIACNPFSKTDKKTKEYTALRQPISAAIAVSGGFAMTKGVDIYLNKLGSEGLIPSLDLRVKPNDDYLKRDFAKDYKNAPNKEEFLKNCKPELEEGMQAFKNGKMTAAYKRACQKGYIKIKQSGREQLFTKLISEHPDNIKINEQTKVISILKDGKLEKIGENIPNMTTQKELTSYLEKNSLHKMKLSEFMAKNFKADFYEGGKIKPFTIDGKLRDIKAIDFIYKLGLIEDKKGDGLEINRIMSVIRQEKIEKPIADAFYPGALKETGAATLINEMSKQSHRLDEMMQGEKEATNPKVTLGQVFEKLGFYRNEKSANLQTLMDKKMTEILDIFSGVLRKHPVKDFNVKAEIPDFAKNIIKNDSALKSSNFGVFKTYAGIVSNLPMAIITCTALNWVYPRVVEALFPSLLKDSAPKGGNK